MLLSTIQTLYAYFIESDVVFVGKRRTSAKRVCPSLLFAMPKLT